MIGYVKNIVPSFFVVAHCLSKMYMCNNLIILFYRWCSGLPNTFPGLSKCLHVYRLTCTTSIRGSQVRIIFFSWNLIYLVKFL